MIKGYLKKKFLTRAKMWFYLTHRRERLYNRLIEIKNMEKREIAKFLSGFFVAGALMHIFIILAAGYFPNAVFDLKIWTISFTIFIIFSILFAYIGWGIKAGKKYITFLMILLLGSSFFAGFNLLKLKNINLLQASVVSSLKNRENMQSAGSSAAQSAEAVKTLSFSLGADKYDGGKVIDTDKDGNIYTAGYFQGTINLDPNGGLLQLNSIGNSEIVSAVDIYLAKYTPDKKIVWGFSIGSVGKDMPTVIKTDKDNNVYLAGYFGGLADFNPDANKENNLDAVSGRNAFLAKYDKDGNFVWAKKIGNPVKIPFTDNDSRFAESRDISIDRDNNVYLAGVFTGTVNLDEPNSNTPENNFTSLSGSRDIFVAKYDSSGNYLSGISFGGSGRDEVMGVRIGLDGSIYLAGSFAGQINLDAKDKKNKKTLIFSNGGRDSFLVKYDKDFKYVWNKKWGGINDDDPAASGLEIDNNDNVYVAGNFSGSLTMGGKTLTGLGASNIIFGKYDKEGTAQFAKAFGSQFAKANKIKLDNGGNIYIGGSFKIMCDFNPAKEPQALVSVSEGSASDAFLAKYSPDGGYLWARDLGGNVLLGEQLQSTEGIAVDAQDNYPIVTGVFYDKINFHSTDSLDLNSRGESDAFIVEYNDNGEIE
jgi:hypothetical protein